MRSPTIICTMLFILLFTQNFLYANPVLEMPVTQVYYSDPQQWVIELNLDELPVFSPIPVQTDEITIGFSEDAMQTCAMPIPLDPIRKTATIVSDYFPTMKLQPGMRIVIGIMNGKHKFYGPDLPANLRPNTTIVLVTTETTCSDYIAPGHVETYRCTQRDYVVTECPSSFRMMPKTIVGKLIGSGNKPLTGFSIECITFQHWLPQVPLQTNGDGLFYLANMDTCPSYLLRCKNTAFSIDYLMTKLPGKSTQSGADFTVRIPFPPITSSLPRQMKTGTGEPAAQVFASRGKRGCPVVLVVSDNSLQGRGVCELYSFSGKLIRSLPFFCQGAGTYSIAWQDDRSVSAGTCLCRITIGPEVVCRHFIVR